MISFQNKITAIQIKGGFLSILKENAKHFPTSENPLKIICVFESEEDMVQLTFNPKLQFGRIFGLTGWYRLHKAKPGDFVKFEVIEQSKAYKLTFVKGKEVGAYTKSLIKKDSRAIRGEEVGESINFRGVVYGPINEQGVVFLFGKVHDDLNLKIEAVRQSFPDARIRRFNGRSWNLLRCEFEYKSSDFLKHGHDIKGCDLIVCWQDDWRDCPVEVIELKTVIKDLGK